MVSICCATTSCSHTIKLHDTPHDGLGPGTAAVLTYEETSLLGLVEVPLEEAVHGQGDEGEDDGEATKAPSPVDVLKELLSRLGSGESGHHVRGGGESVGETSVLELGGIGRDDIDTIGEARPANLPKDLEAS